MMNTRVTILIPSYNRGYLIEKTIKDCFLQTYKDFNIIIYDDASTDNTEKIVKKLINKYPNKIKYIKGNINKGIGYARNILISKLNTEFGMWLDSDDFMTSDRIEKCISYLDNNNEIDIVYSNIQRFISDGDQIILKSNIIIDVNKYHKDNWNSLKLNTTCATGFFRKKLSKFKFESSLRLGGEDVLWIWNLLQKNIKIGHINESLYLYRNHQNRIGNLKRKPIMKDIKKNEDLILAKKIKEIQQ